MYPLPSNFGSWWSWVTLVGRSIWRRLIGETCENLDILLSVILWRVEWEDDTVDPTAEAAVQTESHQRRGGSVVDFSFRQVRNRLMTMVYLPTALSYMPICYAVIANIPSWCKEVSQKPMPFNNYVEIFFSHIFNCSLRYPEEKSKDFS